MASTASERKDLRYQLKIGFLIIPYTKRDLYWSFWCQGWSYHQYEENFWGNRAVEAVEAVLTESWKLMLNIRTFSCRRLLRSAYVTFSKTKNVYQKFMISGFQNYFQTRFYLHITICQSQFIKSSSMWDTLYWECKCTPGSAGPAV